MLSVLVKKLKILDHAENSEDEHVSIVFGLRLTNEEVSVDGTTIFRRQPVDLSVPFATVVLRALLHHLQIFVDHGYRLRCFPLKSVKVSFPCSLGANIRRAGPRRRRCVLLLLHVLLLLVNAAVVASGNLMMKVSLHFARARTAA